MCNSLEIREQQTLQTFDNTIDYTDCVYMGYSEAFSSSRG